MPEMKQGTAAVQFCDCTDGPTTCRKVHPARCVTPSGKETTPHAGRWKAGGFYAAGYNSRQSELDTLKTAAEEVAQMWQRNFGTLKADRDQIAADLAAARARIAELEAQQPTEPPVEPEPPTPTIPAGYKTLYARDFTTKPEREDWTFYTGTQGNNGATFRDSTDTVIKWGPDGQELIARRDGTGIASGASRLTSLAIPQYFYARFLFKLTGWEKGSWPSIWLRPHSSTGGEGEIDLLEAFGGHIGTSMPRLWCSTIILTPYGSSQTNLPGSDWKIPAADYDKWHVLETLKVKGQMTTTVDGTLRSTIKRPSGAAGEKWDAQMEDPAKRWYLRLDHQAGTHPSGKGEAGAPAASWRESRQAMRECVIAVPA